MCSLSHILVFVFTVVLSGEIPVSFLLEGVPQPFHEFSKCDLLSLCSGAKMSKVRIYGLDLDRSMASQVGQVRQISLVMVQKNGSACLQKAEVSVLSLFAFHSPIARPSTLNLWESH